MAPFIRRFVGTSLMVAGLLALVPGGEPRAAAMLPSSVHEGGILARAIVTGDFDANGIVDLAVLSQGYGPIEDAALSTLLGNGDGTFRPAPKIIIGQTGISLLSGDLNLDGKTDLVIDMFGNAGFRVRLSNGDGTFQSAPNVTATASSSRGVLADFTSDGKLDLLVIKGTATATFEVFRGVGDGTFLAPSSPTSVPSISGDAVVGDVNLDGRADVVTGAGGSGVRVFLGQGDGTFTPVLGVSEGAIRLARLGDMDRDGRPDLVMETGDAVDGGTVSIFRGNGNGTFQEPAYWSYFQPYGIEQMTVGDQNGDGWPDLVITDIFLVEVLVGTGTGTLALQESLEVGDFPFQVLMADLDGRGKKDLALVAVYSHSAFVLLSAPDGTFGRLATNPIPIPIAGEIRSVTMADLNLDGIPDLAGPHYMVSGNLEMAVALALSGGGYDQAKFYPVGRGPVVAIAADVNHDLVPDLVTANRNFVGNEPPQPGSVSVLIGIGNGEFLPEIRYPIGFYPAALSAGDLDADGDLDLVVTNRGISSFGIPGDLSILEGNGNGTFAFEKRVAAGLEPRDLAIADLTGDSRPDLAVVSRGAYPDQPGELSLLPGNGTLTFGVRTVLAQGLTFASLAAGDLEGDGDIDLFTTDEGDMPFDAVLDFGHSKVFLNNGTGGFVASAPLRAGVWPYEGRLHDFNGDGITDLVVTNNDSDDIAIFPGRGDGSFRPAERHALSHHQPLLVGRFDRDSRPDLIAWSGNGLGAFLNAGSPRPEIRMGGPSPHLVAWQNVPLSAGYDVVKGNLSILRTAGFPGAVTGCAQAGGMAQNLMDSQTLAVGQALFYVVRSILPSGAKGSYDGGGPRQVAPRDPAIAASGHDCP